MAGSRQGYRTFDFFERKVPASKPWPTNGSGRVSTGQGASPLAALFKTYYKVILIIYLSLGRHGMEVRNQGRTKAGPFSFCVLPAHVPRSYG
jgi:hypothetical protein